MKEYEDQIAELSECDSLIVILDFKFSSEVVNSFILKRLLQIECKMEKDIPHIQVVFATNEEELKYFQEILFDNYLN